ncbi:AAA family ATPase [Rhodococcus opacus]|uniref:AAA family ATPase n=1 Tax=Rhodococcus opacus TaxID=37919 RepID=UPI00295345F4|nr:AAA family ATPase [Rhodococcus opacus]MDV7089485.1 AAA family ATPase [Rhodococcus opacus]
MRKFVDPSSGWDDPFPRVWRATDLQPAQQPRWLAKGRLPRGAVSILIGDEGIGKSLLWVHIAAAVTTGRALPEFGIPERDQANVLVVVTEDDWSTTVLPRLHAAGADLGFVHVICADDDGSGSPTFPNDIQLVQNADPVPALVVVDAWLDTVPSGLSVKDPQGARQALHPWKDVATKTDAAIMLLTHTNRSSTGNARDKYGATSELRKKARMTLFAQRDENELLTVGPEKSNTTGKLPATMFRIDPVQYFDPTEDHDGTVPKLVFVGESDRTAGEILTSMSDVASGDGTAGDVEGWLLSFLGDNADGRQKANDVYTAADAVGYSKDMAKRAKAKLGIDAVKDGSSWFWQLPQQGSAQAREHGKGGMSEDRSLTPFEVRDSFDNAPLNDDERKGARVHDSDTPPSRPLGVWLGSGEPVMRP